MPRIFYRRCWILSARLCLMTSITFALYYIEVRRNHDMHRNATLMKLATDHKHINKSEHDILKMISDINTKQEASKPEDGFSVESTIVLAVLTDKYSKDFNIFLTSLSEVTGIEEALIVFSHSYFDETVNIVIRNIRFCRVLQIFYPYSIQTHSRTFPGPHADDCSTNMAKEYAQKINCTGAYFPDNLGHYRNPLESERKHHWWWTANQIFERLSCTNNFAGLVIFLEDDFIFSKDFIYMATYMNNLADSVPRCEFVSLGTHSESDNKYNISGIYAARLTIWNSKIHSNVLAFNVTTWNIIASHYDLFCNVDDASWSRSLDYISANRLDNRRFKVVVSEIPRAYKINPCRGRFDCDTRYKYTGTITDFLNVTKNLWFPPYIELYVEIWQDLITESDADGDDPKGGWADPRDKALCYNMTVNKMKRVIMQMLT